MEHAIECCVNNCATARLMNAYEVDPTVDAVAYGCLSQCDVCAQEAFAYVNGTMVVANDPEQLFVRIEQQKQADEQRDAWLQSFDIEKNDDPSL